MRKTALLKAPSIKNNERKKKKKFLFRYNLCYSVHVMENFYWSLWSLNSLLSTLYSLLYCNRLRKQTNKQRKTRNKNQTRCLLCEFGAYQKFVKFVITAFFVFATLLTSLKNFYIKLEMPIKGTLMNWPCS